MAHTTEAHVNAMPDILLYPRDTVMRALEVMHRYGVELLPVVDERHGEVLGHVTLEELRRVGNALPLANLPLGTVIHNIPPGSVVWCNNQ